MVNCNRQPNHVSTSPLNDCNSGIYIKALSSISCTKTNKYKVYREVLFGKKDVICKKNKESFRVYTIIQAELFQCKNRYVVFVQFYFDKD